MKLLKAVMPVITAALVVVLGVFVWRNYRLANPVEEKPEETYVPGNVEFSSGSQEDEIQVVPDFAEDANLSRINLAFAGDFVCHSGLNTYSLVVDEGTYDYTKVLAGSTSYIQDASYAVCTLETTLADAAQYTGYPLSVSPKAVATSLANIGFDLINTATNHAMDGGKDGLDTTLDTLDAAGLAHVGTYRTQEEKDENQGVYMAETNGIKIAFIAYTYGLNEDTYVSGADYAVNILFKDPLAENPEVDTDKVKNDVEYAKSQGADIIVAMMHWGNEYYSSPVDYETELTDTLFTAGVDIIVGGHAYVPQPMEMRVVTDEDGTSRNCFVVYCLGNYASCFSDKNTNLSAILYLDIVKDWDNNKTYLEDVSYIPTFMVDLEEYDVYDNEQRYILWDLHGAIDSYESGNDLGVINETLYDALKQGLEEIHSIFGEEYDYFVKNSTDSDTADTSTAQ